jgi:hypothetical protein
VIRGYDTEARAQVVARGDSFLVLLGALYHRADEVNRAKLRAAFPAEINAWERSAAPLSAVPPRDELTDMLYRQDAKP